MTNRILWTGVLFVAALTFGCEKSDQGGGGGNGTFKIVVPAMSTTIKQGEMQPVKISVDRSDGFKQKVKLDIKAPDAEGIHVDPNATTVDEGDKGDVQLKVTAAKDAALGDHKVMVTATPDTGAPTEVDFKVTVAAK